MPSARILTIRVRTEPLSLTRSDIRVFENLERYDTIAFTSKNARRIFGEVLRARKRALPSGARILQVGPREELLTFEVKGKCILFPRSARAPYDIVRRLRARGATVRVISLYTAQAIPLTKAERAAFRRGAYSSISFSSPSGVADFLRELTPAERRIALALPARCIGPTTAAIAKKAGFKITGV